MEELLIFMLQIAAEFLVEVLGSVPFDLMFSRGSNDREERESWEIIGCLCLGVFLGGCSLIVAPTTLLHQPWLRMINLFAAPICSGYVSYGLGLRRYAARGEAGQAEANWHFWYSFMICLGAVAVRFVCATR